MQCYEDTLMSFYTKESIGRVFQKILGDINPSKVIDLGAGEGNLSKFALEKWPSSRYVTVDIDHSVECNLRSYFSNKKAKHFHYNFDALDCNLINILKNEGKFDLAVCNPPFYKAPLDKNGLSILESSNFIRSIYSASDNSAELMFLGQNLRLLKSGGILAIILPDGFVTGRKNHQIRKNILENHNVKSVLQLQNHSFHKTEARCFIVVIQNNGTPQPTIDLLKQEKDGNISNPISVSAKDAVARMDYDYHKSIGFDSYIQLKSINADIRRGSLSTTDRKNSKHFVFHTTDFKSVAENIFKAEPSSVLYHNKIILAEPGDILMARVDRSLHKKVALVASGTTPITDCVYRIRVPSQFQEMVFKALISQKGEDHLLSATKGVGARLIGKKDLLDLKIPI